MEGPPKTGSGDGHADLTAATGKVIEILRRFDSTGNRTMTRQMLTVVIKRLDPQITDKGVETLFRANGVPEDGVVDYESFINWICLMPHRVNQQGRGASEGTLSALTWNVAAVNNNPFEYWIAFDDERYVDLMVGVEDFLDSPGDRDVMIGEVFSDVMFKELKDLMLRENLAGVDEVEWAMWHGGELRLKSRRIITEFLKDTTLGEKRLISMPDRVTNTIMEVCRKRSEYRPPPACRPTVINNYMGDLSTLEAWWDHWKQFMFSEKVTVRTKTGINVVRPVAMLESIPRNKYPAVTEQEERLAVPLQLLCQAIFDAIMVYIMNKLSPDGTWQIIKQAIYDKLYRQKGERTLEILQSTYCSIDVICMQEVSAIFPDIFLHTPLATSHECVLPATLDGKRDQNSVIILKRDTFDMGSVREVTSMVIGLLDSDVRLADGDLIVIEVCGAVKKDWHLLVSFHGDTAGVLTLPVLRAVKQAIVQHFPAHVVVLGLDANAYEEPKRGQLGFSDLVKEFRLMGFSSCFGENPDATLCRTTCCARTSLQPQFNKATRFRDRVTQSDMNPKDLILFRGDQVVPVESERLGQPNPVKDNTGHIIYREASNFPTLDFPSDHGIVAVVLRHLDSYASSS